MDHSVRGSNSSSPAGGVNQILLLVALAACGIGQYNLSFTKDMSLGALFYIFGVLVLAVGLATARYSKAGLRVSIAKLIGQQPLHRIVFGANAVVGLLLSLYTIRSSAPFSLLMWEISILLALLAALPAGANPFDISKWYATRLKNSFMVNEVVAVIAITAAGGLLRLWDLEGYPTGIHGDEAEFGTLAQAILRGAGPHPFGTAFLGDPALFVHLETPFLLLFGQTITALRLFAALTGMLSLPAFYLFVRALFGVRPALLAISILAGSAVHINFSRLGLNIPQVMLFSPLALWAMWEGYKSGRLRCWFGAGILTGIAFYFHFSARLLLAVSAVYLLYLLLLHSKRWREWVTGGAFFGVGFAIVLSPMIWLLASESHKLTEHSAGRLIFNHWPMMLTLYKTNSALDVLLGQIKSNILGFIVTPDAGPFYSFAGVPIFPFVLAPFAVLGICFALLRFRDSRYGLISIWFWVVVIGGGVITIDSPQAHRLVGAALPAIASIAVILESILQLSNNLWGSKSFGDTPVARAGEAPRSPGVAPWTRLQLPLQQSISVGSGRVRKNATAMLTFLVISVPVAASYVDVSHYFGPAASAYPWEVGSIQGKYVATLGPGYRVFVAGTPHIYFNHGVTRYLAPDVVGDNLQSPEQLPFTVPADRDLAVLVYPHANHFLPTLKSLYPSGKAEPVYGYRGQVVFTAYRIPQAEIER